MNKYAITFTAALLAFGSLAAQEAPRSRKSMPTPTLRRAVRDVRPLKKQDDVGQKIEKKKDSNRSTTGGDRWQDSFSREPMWFIQCSIGTSNDPQGRGRAPWWYGSDGVDWLVNEIRRAYGFGARRFFINRPVGDNGPDVPNVGASWLTMDRNRRGELTDKMADLMSQHPEIEVYWHVGSDLADPRRFTSGLAQRDNGFYTLGDTSSDRRINATRATLGGWLSVGAAGLSLDYTGQPFKREHMVNLAQSLRGDPFNFTIIGEAIPYIRDNQPGFRPDYEATTQMPWVATMTIINQRFGDRVQFDRDDTRVLAWFAGVGRDYGNPIERVREIQRVMDLGYIPITGDKEMFLAAMDRARQMGEVDR